jgi:hypothetical protein
VPVSALKQIGIIASESSETGARVILGEGEERKVKAEDLVRIANRNGNEIVGVLRQGQGFNENLRPGGYHPGVAYARMGGAPSTAKETYDFRVAVIGEMGPRSVQQNKMIIAPGSLVELYEDRDNPMEILAGTEGKLWIGHYEAHSRWKIPVNPRFVPYHVGVFGTTGSGKSFLARYVLIPLLMEAGYNVLVFDWKGRDYAPHYKEDVIPLSDIALDDEVVISYLAQKMRHFGYSTYQRDSNPVVQQLGQFVAHGEWRQMNPKEFRPALEHAMIEGLNPKDVGSGKPKEDEQRFRRGFARLKEEHVRNILGTKKPEDIVKDARKAHVKVIDLSRASTDEKLSIFLTFANYLRDLTDRNVDLNLALLIDEAPQYCPFDPKGSAKDTTDIIIDLCALGRTYQLCICLLSQGIAGEIGVNAAVRRNLNTQFVGSIHPLDMLEASNWLSPYAIDTRFLLTLPPGKFYFLGKMNPSPIPLLMTFEIEEA